MIEHIGDLEALHTLLVAGVKVTTIKGIDGMHTLYEAAWRNLTNVVELFLAHAGGRQCVNMETNSGDTPLLRAARKGNFNICEMLVRAGADVNLCDGSTSPLHVTTYSSMVLRMQ